MKKMNSPKFQELFSNVENQEALDIFMKFFELPDDQFEKIWPMYREQFKSAIHSEKFQAEQRDAMSILPGVNIEAVADEREEYAEIIREIKQDSTICEAKKEFIEILFSEIADIHEQLILSGRTQIEVKITKLNPDAVIPQYAHPTDAGADISAVEEVTIQPGETKIVKTGIAIAIPAGYEVQIRPRSGLSVKSKLRIPNTPGTIDTEYRGEIGVPIWNAGDVPYVIEKGMKIAQMLIAPTPMIKWNEVATVDELGTTSRGDGGFGSTDKAANAG